MKRARRSRFLALAASGVLLLAACGDDDDDTTTDDTEAPAGTDAPDGTDDTDGGNGAEGAFSVDTSDCPDDATEPIEGTIRIGSAMPLSGGIAAAAFAPVAAGLQNYIEYANDNDLLPGYEIELLIRDDQYNPNLTTPAVEGLIDEDDVDLFAGIIGTPNNQAVRDLLNEECYPQLLNNTGAPFWGDVENYPWTTGGLPPYNTETAVYVDNIAQDFPDGATAAIFYVNSEFGESYRNAFEELGPDAGVEILTTQTVEVADTNPPTAQVNAIAAEQPDVVLAVPLGAGCPTFLSEMANARAANAGWEPRVYITSTCASTLVLGAAGQAADGIYTIVTGKDPADPANAEDPAVADYRETMMSYGFGEDEDFATAGAGWTNGEILVEILRLASESEDGITRASILNAARSVDLEFQLARPGVAYRMDGERDAFGLESLQVVQYNAGTGTYTDIGELNTNYEGRTAELPQ